MKLETKFVSVMHVLAFMFALLPMGLSTANAAPCYWAQFIADVTIPDGTSFAANTAFQKTWRVKNNGACAWDSNDVSLAFDSGELMSAPASLPLPATILPGQTVDITVNMTAPSTTGHYFGYWKFNSASAGRFGIGSTANKSFWVEIYVTSPSSMGYDFTANASFATWSSGAGYLSFPGDIGSQNGFGVKLDAPVMENGVTSTQAGLLFSPQNTFNGYVQVAYPAFHIQSGDRFQAIIGCEYGATNCYVSYALYYQIGSGSVKKFWTFRERYEGLTYKVNLDLSSLANQDVKFTLAISAYGLAAGDRALWVNPIISGVGALPPTSVPSLLPDLTISNVYLGMQGIPGNSTNCVSNYAPFEIRVIVQNHGQAPAYNISVTETSIGTNLMVGELGAGQSMELYFPSGLPSGTYNFVVDPQNAIPELNENNNVFSYLPITPTPPAICTPVVTPTFTPAPQYPPLITWQSANTPCQTASFWAEHMTYGYCPPSLAPVNSVYYSNLPAYYNIYLSRYAIWQKAYAPFTAQTRVGTVRFNGSGYVIATPAEQRMMAEWAIAMFSELPESSTSGLTPPISAQFSGASSCFSMAVYRDGRYRVDSCLSSYTYPAPDGYLDANELIYFYHWLDDLQPYQETITTGTISFTGDGSTAPELTDKVAVESMVLNLETRARANTSGGGRSPAAYAAQKLLGRQLGILAEQIQIVHLENIDFPDSCLGAPQPNEVCAQVVTSGLRVMLAVQGMLYEFRTDSAGYNLRLFGSPQPAPPSSGLKLPDSDSPASGICAEVQGSEVVEFTLTADGPAVPRCAKVTGSQRIKFTNATNAVIQVNFAHFNMSILPGSWALLDQRVDEYLAPGVHFVNGAEVWLVAATP